MDLSELNLTALTVVGAFATAVATLTSVTLSALWRLADRERVAWATYSGGGRWIKFDGRAGPGVEANLANVGRADAMDVRAKGVGCVVVLVWLDDRREGGAVEMAPIVPAGTRIGVTVRCDIADWDRAAVALTWIASPRLFRKRSVELIRLSELVAEPPRGPTESEAEELGLPPTTVSEQATSPPPLRPVHPRVPRRWDLLGRRRLRRAVLANSNL